MTRFNNSLKELPVDFTKWILLQMGICLKMHEENKKIKNQAALIFDNIFSHIFGHRIFFGKQHHFPIESFSQFYSIICLWRMHWLVFSKYMQVYSETCHGGHLYKMATCVSWSNQSFKYKFSIEINMHKAATFQRRPHFLIPNVGFL